MFSLVVKHTSIHALFFLMIMFDLELEHLDKKMAFRHVPTDKFELWLELINVTQH